MSPDKVLLQTWAMMLVPLTILVLLLGAVFSGCAQDSALFNPPRAQRVLFRSAGVIMLLAAVGMVTKFF